MIPGTTTTTLSHLANKPFGGMKTVLSSNSNAQIRVWGLNSGCSYQGTI